MARFPNREAEILPLTSPCKPASKPMPPSFHLKKAIYYMQHDAALAAAPNAEAVFRVKTEALEALTHAMKADFRYAETAVDFDDDKLKPLGWAGRKPRPRWPSPDKVSSWKPPNRATATSFLDWKAPADGGTVTRSNTVVAVL